MEQGNTYRILIGDDHVLFRRGLKAILSAQPDMRVADEASSLEEVIQKAERQAFDLILLNAALVQPPGAIVPPTPTLLLTTGESGEPDSISRTAPPSEIVATVRSHARLARRNLQEPSSADLEASRAPKRNFGTFPGLTTRESEILRLLADSLTAREVAIELGLSIKTVEAHKLNVMRKLGVHNRASLIEFVAAHGGAPASA